MTRTFVPLLATGMVVAAISWCATAAAQQPPTAAPEPKMPPMPSMEGQQGDVSKPVTQIPSRKKEISAPHKGAEKGTPAPALKKKVTPTPAPKKKKR